MEVERKKPKVVCASAVKNEAWIIDHFIIENSVWADEFVIRNQRSVDETNEILAKHVNVHAYHSDNDDFDELQRRKELIEKARTHEPDVIIVLDADEILVGDFAGNDWLGFLNSAPGTVATFRWPQIINEKCWDPPTRARFGLVDDGRSYIDAPSIHTPRIPIKEDEITVDIDSVSVLHLQYVPVKRNDAKQRFYQCYEYLAGSRNCAIEIFRQYSKHHDFDSGFLRPLSVYEKALIHKLPSNISSDQDLGITFDLEVLKYLELHGPRALEKVPIWNVNWEELSRKHSRNESFDFDDPRTPWTKLVHLWLHNTKSVNSNLAVRIVDKLLKSVWT